MYHIAADSGCDIFTLGGVSFATAPLTISTASSHFLDDSTLDIHAMIEYLRTYKGRSFTACPSTEAWLSAFDMENHTVPDELYIVTLTSGLSGTYNSANVAKDIYLSLHPDTKALVIDTLSVGPEMRLILEKIATLKADGKTFEEVAAEIEAYRQHTRLFFAFKSLHNLAENGRVSKLVAAAAGVLSISLIGTASPEGQITPLGKARGERRVIASLRQHMTDAGYHGGKIRITHVENESFAQEIADEIRRDYPSADIAIYPVRGLCSFYCERGGICIGCET